MPFEVFADQTVIPGGRATLRTPEGRTADLLRLDMSATPLKGMSQISHDSVWGPELQLRSIEGVQSPKRRKKIRKKNLKKLADAVDEDANFRTARESRSVYGRLRRHPEPQMQKLRAAEILMLRCIRTATTVQQLANQTQLEPLQFASTFGQLSKNGFIQVRGETCKKLLPEATQAVEDASRKGQSHTVTWKKHLMRLAGIEQVVRSANPDRLKVATAPIRLTRKAETFLAQLKGSEQRHQQG